MSNSNKRLGVIGDHILANDVPPVGLCFSEALAQYKTGKISREQYFRHCLMHFVKGFPRHAEDKPRTIFDNLDLKSKDPFTYALWCWQDETSDVEDVAQLEAIFNAYYHGTLDDLQARLRLLHIEMAETMRRALAWLAFEDRKLDVLKYVLNDGQDDYDPFHNGQFHDMAEAVDHEKEPELHSIIHRSVWMGHVKKRQEHALKVRQRFGDAKVGAHESAASDFDDLW